MIKLLSILCFLSTVATAQNDSYSLVITVEGLRNSEGVIQYSLYNKDGTIPDEKYKNFYLQATSPIVNKTATYSFDDLPVGNYAINILHDENQDGKIKKGFVLPIEGIGFSNFNSIGLRNKPSFKKAQLLLDRNLAINIKVIYF
jgi:uncharacterized protein (DUF2141 family)